LSDPSISPSQVGFDAAYYPQAQSLVKHFLRPASNKVFDNGLRAMLACGVVNYKGHRMDYRKFLANAAKRREKAIAMREAGKYWPPDYLILGGAAPGGSSLRSALVRLQHGAEGPVLISEEEFMAALHATPVLNEDGSLNPDLSQLRFTPHRATTRTGQFLRRRSAWAANPKRSLKVKSSD
jgi:hypothetical protein